MYVSLLRELVEKNDGMLSGDDVILKGLVSIKLKEEDPLMIGYITRQGSSMSEYGKAYIEELLKYKEL